MKDFDDQHEEKRFSFFQAPIRRSLTPTATWSPRDAYEYIVSERAKVRTETLRTIDDKAKRQEYKRDNFDFATFGGRFSTRSNAGLLEPSGLLCVDIDHLPTKEALKAVRKALLDDPFFVTVLLFLSPSSDGLKWLINVDGMGGFSYSEYYKAVQIYLLSIGIVADNTSDIVRACYLPYDPDCYFSEGDDDRERETFNPAMWLQLAPSLPLAEKKATTKIKKNEGTDAQDEAQTSACVTYNFTNVNSRRNFYRLYLRGELEEKVEDIVSKLEELGIDIAPTYHEWVTLGFRLVDGLGKEGLDAFVRLSALHPGPQKIAPREKYQQLLDEGAQRTRIDYFIEDAEQRIKAAQPDEREEADEDIYNYFNINVL